MLKPANDPDADYKALVQRGYNRIAAAYEEERQKEADAELTILTGRRENGAKVLDVGCGTGVPIARALSQRFEVTGIDISREMIRRAKKNDRNATFIQGDIVSIDLPMSHFDAAVAFYTIFHNPRLQHEELFRRIHAWLKPGGYFLATLSYHSEEPYTEDDYFGITMYWSSYSLREYEEMLDTCGFKLLATGSTGHG